MTTDPTPSPDVRELAIKADGEHYFPNATTCVCGWKSTEGTDWLMHKLDAVLAAVSPVIRRQVAEELHQQAAKWHATVAPYKSHYAIAWDDAVDFILAEGSEEEEITEEKP